MSPAFIREGLAKHVPQTTPFEAHPDRAAVALVVAGDEGHLQMCFIRRATRTDDPWSGQMAFPGGRLSAGDQSARGMAEREAFEEVGLVLSDSDWIGVLSELPVRREGLETDMVLSPFVYYIGRDTQSLEPNDEVAEGYWIPLAHLWDCRNADRVRIFWGRKMEYTFPAIRFGDQLIWGLTLRVLTQFAEALGQPLPGKITAS